MIFTYPQGKEKALTFSYDDGQEFDKRLIAILDAHGMKGTFHLNSGKLGFQKGRDSIVKAEEIKEIYAGHEVACHGVKHLNLPSVNRELIVAEIQEDRKRLEELTGGFVQGMSYAYGNYDEEIKTIAKSLGIKYSRTVKDTGVFFPPADFLEWHPTCHFGNHTMELGERFLGSVGNYGLPVMYVWGHSFEFGWPDDWSGIEAFADKMAGKEEIWYATNMEIYRYVQATRSQEFSADGHLMYNPTKETVWVLNRNQLLEVKPGQTVEIEP